MTSKLSFFFPGGTMGVTLTESLAPAATHSCQSTPQPPFFCSIYIHQLQYTLVNPHPNLPSSAPYIYTSYNTPLSIHTPTSILLLHIYLQLFSYSPLQPSVKDRSHDSHQSHLSEILARNQCSKPSREAIIFFEEKSHT